MGGKGAAWREGHPAWEGRGEMGGAERRGGGGGEAVGEGGGLKEKRVDEGEG